MFHTNIMTGNQGRNRLTALLEEHIEIFHLRLHSDVNQYNKQTKHDHFYKTKHSLSKNQETMNGLKPIGTNSLLLFNNLLSAVHVNTTTH